MTKVIKAIPTTYKGIEFRSKLEAKYAQALDMLGIVWEYEGHGFRFDDGTCYSPDFYMPEIDTYLEVKGVMDEASRHKVELTASEAHKRIVVGGPDGTLTMYNGTSSAWDPASGGDSVPVRCTACGKAFLLDEEGGWSCPACGAYDGDHYIEWLTNSPNLFKAVGW